MSTQRTIAAHDVVACPLCGSRERLAVYGRIERCAKCGLVQTRRDAAALSAFDYDDGAYFTERNEYISQRAAFEAHFFDLIRRAKRHGATGRLLDVGCGPGLLMEVAQKEGFDANGCDVSAWATDYARDRGLQVRTGRLEDLAYPPASFDVVVCNHTLEHVEQPLELALEMKRILRDDGLMVIGVPNFDGVMSKLMRERWGALLPDQHLWHFTPKTLRQLLRQAGCASVSIEVLPSRHWHPHPLKRLTLSVVDRLGELVNGGDAMIAFARKAQNP